MKDKPSKLCRVITFNHESICGMCGKRHKSHDDALECMTNDILNLQSIPMTDMNSHDGCFYHCLLCGKRMVNAEDAALCVSHDLENVDHLPAILQEHLKSMVINTLKGPKPPPRKRLNSRHSDYGMHIPKKK